MSEWRPVQVQPQPPSRVLEHWLVALTVIVLVGQAVMQILMRQMSPASAPDLDASLRSLSMTLPFMAIGLAQTVVALVWMYHVSANVTRFGMQGRQWGPGWAVGSWFIPVANLVLPLFALVEIWKGSDPQADPITWKAAPFPALLGWLWALWVISQVASVGIGIWAGIRTALSGASVQPPLMLSLAQAAIYMAGGVLFILFVRRVGTMQALRFGIHEAHPGVPG